MIEDKPLKNAIAFVSPYLPVKGELTEGQWTGIELYQDVETKGRVSVALRQIAKVAVAAKSGMMKLLPAALLAVCALQVQPAQAGQTRALKIYHVHSHEKAIIVFKRNGRYDAAGLKKLNYILRDWRRNEPTRMDPRLFDLIWEVYQKSGSHEYINVIGGYRAPETNLMLRTRTKGVAEKSQHILGKAMDFYIPDVSLRKLREIGMKFQVGGVGFYPTSGSPFVHMDVGGVRSWPRMPRRELARLFPDGRTLHKPAEGGVMPGYAAALADYRRRVGSDAIMVAGGGSSNSDRDSGRHKSLLAALFGGGGDETEEDVADASGEVDAPAPAAKTPVRQQAILTAAAEPEPKQEEPEINAPVPLVRPAYSTEPAMETALLSTNKNPAEEAMLAALTPKPEDEAEKQPEFVDLAKLHVPAPNLLGPRVQPGDSEAPGEVVTASLDPSTAALLTAAPVPEMRPAEVKAKVAAAEKAEDVVVPPADVKPSEIAALAAESVDGLDDETTDEDEVAGIIGSLGNGKGHGNEKLAEIAALDVPTQSQTRSFELPATPAVAAEEEHRVIKGKRPRVGAAMTSAMAEPVTRARPKLTGNLIAQWALTKGRAAQVSKPIKAPRFVSNTMRSQPTEVYAQGFAQPAAVDPARFSGSAVNFMPIKKFPETN